MSEATLVYDDDCGFCTWSARRIARHSDVELVGFSELTDDLRGKLPAEYEDCAHLIDGETVYSCGEAIEEATVRSDLGEPLRPVVDFLRQFDEYGKLREEGYRTVEQNRGLFGKVLSADPPARSED